MTLILYSYFSSSNLSLANYIYPDIYVAYVLPSISVGYLSVLGSSDKLLLSTRTNNLVCILRYAHGQIPWFPHISNLFTSV